MNQIKYILYSFLILLGVAMTYAVMKPMVQSQWIKMEPMETGICGTESDEKPIVKNMAGKNLFSANCGTCHAIKKILTGPALADVETRGHGQKEKTW